MAGPVIPIPRGPVTVRPAVAGDLPFIDSLQKRSTHAVGWMPTKQLEGKIAAGHVLVAWASSPCLAEEETTGWKPVPLGYCISRDQYFKRDDVGIVYQLNVAPERQRGLVGAALLKATFERAAYGCKLFCCWCAQDIEANYFWESMGFVPLAFRAGSREKGRVHIFWQRRIHAGDRETPYWFPSQTTSGSLREDRLVFPIPPGTHWSDAKPIVLPGAGSPELEVRARKPKAQQKKAAAIDPSSIASGGLRFVVRSEPAAEPKPKRQPKPKVKNDPRLVAAARELRDRWLEHVNAGETLIEGAAKYDVSRSLVAPSASIELKALPHAA